MKNANKKSKKERIAENEQKKEIGQEKDVLFCCQIEKSVFKKLIKEQANYCAMFANVLDGILFELKDDILTMVSTDGNKLLETKVKAYSAFKSGSKVYNGNYLRNIKFLKNICIFSESYVDMLQINFYEDCMTIKDLANSIEYNVPKVDGQFPPNWKKLFPTIKEDGKYTTIGVNIQFIKELSKLSFNQRTGIVELSIKNNSPLSAILAKAKNPDGDISNRVLIMPIQIRH